MSNGYEIQRYRGKLALVFWDDNGKRRRHTLKTNNAEEARRCAPNLYASLTRPKGKTVAEIWGAYAKEVVGRPTAERLVYAWKVVGPHFGSLEIDNITVDDCRAFVAERHGKGIKDGTIHSELGMLRTVLNWAVKRGLATAVSYIERPSAPPPKDRHLTREQMRALIDAAVFPHVRLGIVLLYCTAARVSALLQLQWRGVDFERRKIDLRNEDLKRQHKGRAIVPMNTTAFRELKKAKPAALSDFVIEYGGGPIKSIKKGVTLAGNRIGVKVSPHVLRHSAAVHMAENGVPMEEIAQYLGHSDISTTRRIYARFSPQHLSKAARALDFDLEANP